MRGRQNFPGTSTGTECAGPASGLHQHPGRLRAWWTPLMDSRQSPAFHPAAESAIALDFLIVTGLSEITECADFFFVFTFLKCSLLTHRLQLFSWSTSWLMKATAVLGGVNLFSAWNRPYLSPAHDALGSRFKHTHNSRTREGSCPGCSWDGPVVEGPCRDLRSRSTRNSRTVAGL